MARAYAQVLLAAFAQHPVQHTECGADFGEPGRWFRSGQILEMSEHVSPPPGRLRLLIDRRHR
jgi:hypothetical protein